MREIYFRAFTIASNSYLKVCHGICQENYFVHTYVSLQEQNFLLFWHRALIIKNSDSVASNMGGGIFWWEG